MSKRVHHNALQEGAEFIEKLGPGLNLIVAHQYVGQLLPKVQQAVLGNIGTIISFRVGGDDAVKLKPEFAPIFDVKDMINLGVGEFYIKMTIDGESYDPFSAETLRVLPATHPSYHDRIIDASRRQYAIPAGEAQKLIAEEESTIIRSAQEKAAITGGKNSAYGDGEKVAVEESVAEVYATTLP